MDGPKGDFDASVKWVLVNNNLPFTTIPTPSLPMISHSPLEDDVMGMLPVPTADHGVRPAVIEAPEPRKRLEGVIAPEPDPQQTSAQVLPDCLIPHT